MRLLQYIVVLLNFRPFTFLFRSVYSFGLARLLKSLARHEQIQAVFGYGSFFEKTCLYGVSDIDLVLVISSEIYRNSQRYYDILNSYKNVRRFFPFLQHLYELDQNLIFLSDIHSPYALPESVRLRLKQGRLYLLHGRNVFEELSSEAISPNEILSESDGLLRLILMKDIRHTRSLLFWKKSFKKLYSLCETAGIKCAPEREGARAEAAFMRHNDVWLFFRRGDLNRIFLAFLDVHRRLNNEIASGEPGWFLPCPPLWDGPGGQESPLSSDEHFENPRLLAHLRETVEVATASLPSSLVGIAPEQDYFPLDADVSLLRIEGADYDVFLRLKNAVLACPTALRNFLLHTRDLLFVVRKLPTYVDVVPLSPLTCANVYSLVHAHETGFGRMPVSIWVEQREKAKSRLTANAAGYLKNNGWIEKLPFPCLYMEDDLDIVRQAFHRMRLFLFHEEGLCFRTSRDLLSHVGGMHPRCRDFLDQLISYYDHLRAHRPTQTVGNNLYCCLHQFMGRLLSGEKDIAVDEPTRHLGICVGIITRNRAADLREVMASLVRQIRPADEIIVVDNGSSDDTRRIIEGFADRLPIRYLYLEGANIPAARNMVIGNAKFEIVAFTDDDCIAEPGWLEAVERGFLRAENIGIVGGWVKHAGVSRDSVIDRYYRIFHHNTT